MSSLFLSHTCHFTGIHMDWKTDVEVVALIQLGLTSQFDTKMHILLKAIDVVEHLVIVLHDDIAVLAFEHHVSITVFD